MTQRETPKMRLVTRPQGPGAVDGADPLAHLDALYRLARHLARSVSDAEDLVQETFARALRGAGGFVPGSDLRAWLFRILRNAFLDQRRREARAPVVPEGAADEPGAAADRARDGWLRGDAELERLRRVVGEEIEAALRSLTEEARLAVLLDLEGLGEAEMAEAMGCPPGTVKSRLSRARAALRERLAEYRR
jgi:RNA polymerase sigma-70 factor, ECF subfamily